MKIRIEFYYKGEVIDHRDYNQIAIIPLIGDRIYIEFSNPSNNELGKWWFVKERRILFFSIDAPILQQTIMLEIEADARNGA